jgi:hypothetical protein
MLRLNDRLGEGRTDSLGEGVLRWQLDLQIFFHVCELYHDAEAH